MRASKLEKTVHCIETVTGQSLTGNLTITDTDIRVEIYNYKGFFQIDTKQPIFLTSSNGQFVSLYDNINTSTGTHVSHDVKIEKQSIISNKAIIGDDFWLQTDAVKRVSFAVKHTNDLLHHMPTVKAMGNKRFADTRIFSDKLADLTLSASYGASYETNFDAPKEFWPIFSIEFNEPQTTENYLKYVTQYLSFLSFCVGFKLSPSNIYIDRMSSEEINEALDNQTYNGDHEVKYVWPEPSIKPGDIWVGGSPVHTRDNEELTSLRVCLASWMKRTSSWKKAYAMMMGSFSLRGEVSVQRLINACRWFEELPNVSSENALSNADIDAISQAAAKEAEDLGHDQVIRKRIMGAIKQIKKETSEQRFQRLVKLLKEKFGTEILPETAIADLKRAIQFRGKTAHGHFNPSNEEEFMAFAKSIHAVEAICYLLTAIDLPIPSEGLTRIKYHPVIKNYRMSL